MGNAQRVQEAEDALDEGLEDDPRFAALDPKDLKDHERPSLEHFKYKKVHVPDEEEVKTLTHRLAGEQMELVMKVADFCKQLVKARNSPHENVAPLRLIIHGGKLFNILHNNTLHIICGITLCSSQSNIALYFC